MSTAVFIALSLFASQAHSDGQSPKHRFSYSAEDGQYKVYVTPETGVETEIPAEERAELDLLVESVKKGTGSVVEGKNPNGRYRVQKNEGTIRIYRLHQADNTEVYLGSLEVSRSGCFPGVTPPVTTVTTTVTAAVIDDVQEIANQIKERDELDKKLEEFEEESRTADIDELSELREEIEEFADEYPEDFDELVKKDDDDSKSDSKKNKKKRQASKRKLEKAVDKRRTDRAEKLAKSLERIATRLERHAKKQEDPDDYEEYHEEAEEAIEAAQDLDEIKRSTEDKLDRWENVSLPYSAVQYYGGRGNEGAPYMHDAYSSFQNSAMSYLYQTRSQQSYYSTMNTINAAWRIYQPFYQNMNRW